MLDLKKVRAFWEERPKVINDMQRVESIVNFEPDVKLLNDKINSEISCVIPKLNFNNCENLLDLGAGIGQWTFRFSPLVKRVIAVEYIEKFIKIAETHKNDNGINNVEFVLSNAEDYYDEKMVEKFDIIFISGLFLYLNDEQVNRLILNCAKMLRLGGQLFLRDGTSILEKSYHINKYSEIIGTDYSALYRTRKEYIKAFEDGGCFGLLEDGQFFDEGSILNKYTETRLRYYSFIKL